MSSVTIYRDFYKIIGEFCPGNYTKGVVDTKKFVSCLKSKMINHNFI